MKSDQIGRNGAGNREGAVVRRLVQKEVKILNLTPCKSIGEKTKYQTCIRLHKVNATSMNEAPVNGATVMEALVNVAKVKEDPINAAAEGEISV